MQRSPLGFVLLVFALSAPIWLAEPEDWPITGAVAVPLVTAVILTFRDEGIAGIARLSRRVFDYRKIEREIWYVPIVFSMPLLPLLAHGVLRSIGLPLGADSSNLLVTIPLLFGLFFVLAIGEEVGWTGYLADALLERRGALTTALALGLLTAVWHLVPLVRMGRTPTWIAWWAIWSIRSESWHYGFTTTLERASSR